MPVHREDAKVPKARRRFSKELKEQVLRDIDAGKTIEEISQGHQLDRKTISRWRSQLGEVMSDARCLNALRKAIESRNKELLHVSLEDTGVSHFAVGEYTDDFIAELLNVLRDEKLIESKVWFTIVYFFVSELELLSGAQRTQIVMFLEEVYPKLPDYDGKFTITEFMAEIEGSELTYQALERLSITEDEVARSYVAHGFEHLVEYAENSDVKSKAYARLRSILATDESEIVRWEANTSIDRLSRLQRT